MAVIELTNRVRTDTRLLEKTLPAKTLGIPLGEERVIPPNSKGLLDLNQGNIFLADGVINNFAAAERYRILRSEIERKNLGKKRYQILSVVSAIPQEGKSVTAVNLSRALSIDPNGRTLLIDCDLRKPSVHHYFEIAQENGLSDVLGDKIELRKAIKPVSPGLDVLTAGTVVDDPARLIEGSEFPAYLEDLRNYYNYIIVDCPPALLCPEPITISSITDGTIMVLRAWKTDKRLVSDAISVIGKERIFGAIMNGGFDSSKPYLSYDYYGYYQHPGKELAVVPKSAEK